MFLKKLSIGVKSGERGDQFTVASLRLPNHLRGHCCFKLFRILNKKYGVASLYINPNLSDYGEVNRLTNLATYFVNIANKYLPLIFVKE